MSKKRIVAVALIFIIVLYSLIAAEERKPIKTDNFVLEFQKPPYNKFFFSDLTDPSAEANMAKGVPFSYVDLSTDTAGYPSYALFAITYIFESKGLFEVYANANLDHTNIYRLYASDAKDGLNYTIEIFANKTDADKGTPIEKTIDTKVSAKNAIYSATITTPMPEKVTKVFKLTLRSEMLDDGRYLPYVEGQYMGYLIMEFTPSV